MGEGGQVQNIERGIIDATFRREAIAQLGDIRRLD